MWDGESFVWSLLMVVCVYVFPCGTQHAVQCDVAAGNALIRLGLGQHIEMLNTSNRRRIRAVSTFAR